MVDEKTRREVRQGFMDGTYHKVGYSSPCPNCGRHTTVYEEDGNWFCFKCDIVFNVEEAVLCYDVKEYEADERPEQELLEEVDNGD